MPEENDTEITLTFVRQCSRTSPGRRLPVFKCSWQPAVGWHGRVKGDTDRLLRGLSAADGSWTAEGSVLKLKTGPKVLGETRLSFPEASTGRPLFGSADDEEAEMSVC